MKENPIYFCICIYVEIKSSTVLMLKSIPLKCSKCSNLKHKLILLNNFEKSSKPILIKQPRTFLIFDNNINVPIYPNY